MAEISQFTGKFKVAGIRKQRPENTGAIKRQRQSLACHQCRNSKLRCDKARPCSSCTNRDIGGSCSYDIPLDGGTKPATENRLNRLEALVAQLLDSQNVTRPVDDPNTPPSLPDDRLRSNVGRGDSVLKDQYPTVVEDIMDSIHQLRLSLPFTGDQPDFESPAVDGKSMDDEFIFGLSASHSRSTVLSQHMPSEREAEQLLATYFGGDTFIQPFIHAQYFQRQYREFKKDQFRPASALWLSTLFSIFAIAAMVPGAIFPGPDMLARSHRFQAAAGQCLVLGKYHNTQRDAPEALLLYAHCKGLKSLDPSRECGAIICIAVRHAYELGYHRDPDSFGKFTVFESEMRRRFWACCKQVDTMVSFQLGLPGNIIFENCDTKSPLNLLDSDFDVDTKVLPLSRPESEATQMLWFIVKDRMMPVFARICQAALSLRIKTEEEVMELDAEVRLAYAKIPDVLRWRSVGESIADPPFLIMCRIFLELLYLKSVCILHRRYMMRSSARSLCQCVDSASSIVRRVVDIHREFQPGGQLHGVSWMFKGIAMTDFLLGAIILCFYVSLKCRGDVPQAIVSRSTAEVLELLRDALTVCLDRSLPSADARKVALAIQLTLRSAEEKASSFAQAPIDASVAEFSNWIDVDTSQLSILNNQFAFSELDPFNFMSGVSADADSFWSSVAFDEDFNN